jgi:hypothetical protein
MADLTTSSAIDTFMQSASQAAARTALGLGTAATQASSAFATAAQGTDSRTPTAHAASHTNGTDDIQSATASQKGLATATQITKLDGIEAAADVTDAGNVGSSINGASAVTTLNDTDKVPVTVAGTLSNIAYSALKTLLNAIYALKGATTSSGLTMGTGKLLGRGTAGTGAIEEITLGTNLSFSGTTLNAAGGGGGVSTDDTRLVAFAADTGSTDAYAATLSPAPSSYTTGAHYRFKANTANTGAATINFNSLGAKTIVKAAGGITTALADNDIRAGQWVDLVYDGTNMQMQSTLGNAGGGGLSAPTLAGINSITSATGQALTLASLDSNSNVVVAPHGTGSFQVKYPTDTNALISTATGDQGSVTFRAIGAAHSQYLTIAVRPTVGTTPTFKASGVIQFGDTVTSQAVTVWGALLSTSLRVGNGTNGPTLTASGTSPNENLNLNPSPAGTGVVTVGSSLRLKDYTVATLPAGTVGDTAYVTDALTPASLVTVTGGGAMVVPVFYNGSNWIVQ